MKLTDKIILVTGGANGIGKALCKRFHADGAAKIYAADIDFETAENVAEAVGGKAFRLDVANEENCQNVVKEILELILSLQTRESAARKEVWKSKTKCGRKFTRSMFCRTFFWRARLFPR